MNFDSEKSALAVKQKVKPKSNGGPTREKSKRVRKLQARQAEEGASIGALKT